MIFRIAFILSTTWCSIHQSILQFFFSSSIVYEIIYQLFNLQNQKRSERVSHKIHFVSSVRGDEQPPICRVAGCQISVHRRPLGLQCENIQFL